MTKAEFLACPRWKQIEMKKETGLFQECFFDALIENQLSCFGEELI